MRARKKINAPYSIAEWNIITIIMRRIIIMKTAKAKGNKAVRLFNGSRDPEMATVGERGSGYTSFWLGGPSPCPFSHSSPRSFRVFLFLAGWTMQVRFVAFSLGARMSPCHERLSAERPALSIISFFSAILFDFSTWGYIAIICDADDDRNRSTHFSV